MNSQTIYGAQQATDVIKGGEHNVYNTKNGMLVIADIVDGGRDDEEYGGGFRADNGEWIYGVMYTMIDPKDATDILKEYDSLSDYALAEIPAPGTCVPNRLRFCPTDSPDELREFFEGLYEEENEGWKQE